MPLTIQTFAWFFEWAQAPTWQLAGLLFVNLLWIPVMIMFFRVVWDAFKNWSKQIHGFGEVVFLAVDVPRDTEQTPMNMEAIMVQLAGAHGTQTWWENKWQGEFQQWFSFEIVSLEGYVQYIIRAPKAMRDLVEASIYAQYPDAEISEVTDYTEDVPDHYPDDEYKMYAMEYLLDRHEAWPIKTYKDFEDRVRGELVDPMAAMLEIMSSIGKGEQIWYQVLAKPVVAEDWLDGARKEIDRFVERNTDEDKKGGILGFLGVIPSLLTDLIDNAFGLGLAGEAEQEENKSPLMQRLTPSEQTLLEDMERKSGKIAYKSLIRIVYVARREVFSKAKGIGPAVGAIKQFNDDSRNWFKPGKQTWTKANYFFKDAREYHRMNEFMAAYKDRSLTTAQASGGYVLSAEELATVYHFPMMSVKAPLVKRTGAKKSEPPSTLPVGEFEEEAAEIPSAPAEPPTAAEPPVSQRSQPSVPEPSGMTVPTAGEDQIRYVDIPDASPKPEQDETSKS